MSCSIYDQLYLYYDVDGHLTISMKVLAFYRTGFFSVSLAILITWEDISLYTFGDGLLCLPAEQWKAGWNIQTDGDKSLAAYYVCSVLRGKLDDDTGKARERTVTDGGKNLALRRTGDARVTVRQLREIEDGLDYSSPCCSGTDSTESSIA